MIIRIYTRRTNLSNNWLRRTKHQIPLPDKQKHFQKMQGMHQSKLQARHFLFKFNFFMRFSMILNSNQYQCFENNANEIYYNHQCTNIHNTSSASPCFPSVFCKFLLVQFVAQGEVTTRIEHGGTSIKNCGFVFERIVLD